MRLKRAGREKKWKTQLPRCLSGRHCRPRRALVDFSPPTAAAAGEDDPMNAQPNGECACSQSACLIKHTLAVLLNADHNTNKRKGANGAPLDVIKYDSS